MTPLVCLIRGKKWRSIIPSAARNRVPLRRDELTEGNPRGSAGKCHSEYRIISKNGKIYQIMISISDIFSMDRIQKYLLPFLLLFILNINAFSQQDSVRADSTKLYKKIETFAKRGRVTTFMYSLVFKPVSANSQKKVYKNLIQKPYSTFEGKIIRNIDIVTLDPFGYSVTDTSVYIRNFLYKAGNATHVKTQGIAIRNLLLISRGSRFRSILVKESERLIRSQKYVQEVAFYVSSAGRGSDSVDIVIREKDKWSIAPDGSVSSSGINIELTDKNFIGMGHEFQNVYSRNTTRGIGSFNTDYFVTNRK